MTPLKPFQESTVRSVLAAFRRRKRARRFLVADEVGLGKTVVAQHVVQRMAEGLGRPLVVFYMCSNLAIARQNRRKLLEILPSNEREDADCPIDRLSLLPASERPTHKTFHLYSLTPDTSIPIRKRHRRDGRQEERALVHALVEQVWPKLFDEWGKDVFQGSASVNWKHNVKEQRSKATDSGLREAFKASVRQEFNLAPYQQLLPELRARELDGLELISHLRNALAASAVEEVKPDLVIFDEFQRFRDLIEPQQDEAAQRVIGRLRGDDSDDPPALLLLSATPYRLYARRWEEETGTSHRAEFFELVEFLYGGDAAAKRKRKQAEEAFSKLETELRKGQPTSAEARAARNEVESLLCPIVSRTERASHDDGWDHFETRPVQAPVAPEDLTVFKHLSRSLDDTHRPDAVPYWTSIPLPMQTMGNHYVAWKSATTADTHGTPLLSKEMRDGFEAPDSWPHPRLRALQELAPATQLAIPWLSPTATWWPLRGVWKSQESPLRKLLVFSRFRAVPQAIAAALSFDLEAELLGGDRMTYEDVSRRKLLSATERHPLLGLFHPSPFLVEKTDPLEARSSDLRVIRREVRRQLKKAISALGVTIREDAPSLPIWKMLGRLERQAGNWRWIQRGWWQLRREIATGEEDAGLAQLLTDWGEEAERSIHSIKPASFELLVDYALGSPGVALGRALLRHWSGAVGEGGFANTLSASWNGLRNYLDQRCFYSLLRKGKESYPDAILRAVVDGNLEAVLDEHLWLISQLQSLSEDELADELRDGLTIKSGRFSFHPLQGNRDDTFSLRCHVAMPFVQSRVGTLERGEKPIRTDEMRRAFNTPFWPYVLATTSVGQEGLDFHAWCDTLVHWDLCRNPVDLEQREGRIQRFGGLSVRRAIAQNQQVRQQAMTERRLGESLWARIAAIANDTMGDASGLAPWWVCKDGKVTRYVFDVPTSEQKHWLQWMKEQRLLYRLALGQPNQEDLIEILSCKVEVNPETIRQAVANLSPWFRNNR
ncbi:helicase-related protein [Methylocystis parvus]|uniref:SWF/SNF helicase family protein n=1 Tax=Methylocystis parvus TaxID=134 RepID=A0A6B8MEK1_9HYPH|nr:helicase-related protein [Methylocystis parvus]QGM99979.1 SWF/SNF helicase family protein [Methylocystis parvus]WBK02210.1 DEAD/DEAH box helicase family protein [Methylocystis parvus OBBP]